ncbi:MAG: PQQ-dependent sugar dehydrogenase [Burkholderiales bacterium]
MMHNKTLALALALPLLLSACFLDDAGNGGGGSSASATAMSQNAGGQTSAAPTGSAGAPVATSAYAGAGQSATTGNAVGIPPAIVIKDAQGRGVSGVNITFIVIAGGGFIDGPNATTDTMGIARSAGWTLGRAPGQNQMVARSSGLPEVTFYATGIAAAGQGSITPVSGADNQTASIGTAVPMNPAVVVKNSAGTAQSGVTVSFSVASGGGAIENRSAVTGAGGTASPGKWTLGATAGTQAVTVSATGFASIQIKATALATGTPTFNREVLMRGLQNPWDIAFSPDGTMFYTERARGLSVRLANGTTRVIFRPADMVAGEQCGMLGVAVDPQFTANRTVYVYMSSTAGGAADSRIVAINVDANYTNASGRRDILTGITYLASAHCGGRVRFGPDGNLYVTTGDTRQGRVPQSLTQLGAKVLRIDRDGNPAQGNNTPAGGNPRIYAFGFRNVQGIDFRPGSGTPYISEHGPGYTDEVTPLRAGGNGGWDPFCAAGSDHGIEYCGYDGNTKMTDTVKFPNAMPPVWSGNGLSEGMGGNAFLKGSQWREWDGALVVALMAGRRLEVLKLDPAGVVGRSTPILNTLNVRLRTPVLGPDGALYVTTDNQANGDEIWRIAPN